MSTRGNKNVLTLLKYILFTENNKMYLRLHACLRNNYLTKNGPFSMICKIYIYIEEWVTV